MIMNIAFSGTTIHTPVYIKLDAPEQLLLSEGVCRQLGIITYHPEVTRRSGPTERTRRRGKHQSRAAPSEERTESGTATLTSGDTQQSRAAPSEERTESGTATLTSGDTQQSRAAPSEERTESGTATLTSGDTHQSRAAPSEERTESGTATLTSGDTQQSRAAPSEERTESGTATLTSGDTQQSRAAPSEERTESGTATLTSGDTQQSRAAPSEERTESGTATLTSGDTQQSRAAPSEERTESGTATLTSGDTQQSRAAPSEERTESGTATLTSGDTHQSRAAPSEERTESGTATLTSGDTHQSRAAPSEERTESGTATLTSGDTHQSRAAPSEERTESGTATLTSGDTHQSRAAPSEERNEPSDLTLHVRLVKSVKLPHHTQETLVRIEGGTGYTPWLVECASRLKAVAELEAEDAVVLPAIDGAAQITLSNWSGFTQFVDGGTIIGVAQPVTVEVPTCLTPAEMDDHSTASYGNPQPRPVQQRDSEEEPQGQDTGEQQLEWARVHRITEEQSDLDSRIRTLDSWFGGVELHSETKEQLLCLLREHNKAFSLEEGERGETDLIEFQIDTGDTTPLRQRARRMPFAVRKEVARQLHAMQETGVVQPSSSPWASPVVLVRKKDGSHRFCVDYRQLNSVTRLDSYPLPRIDDLLDVLGQAQYFTTLDLAAGYWQIPVHQDSIPKTAFITPQGLY